MSTPTLKVIMTDGSEREVRVRSISRKSRRDIRSKYQIDLYREFFKMVNTGEVSFGGDIIDAILDVVYADQDEMLENLSMSSGMALFTETMHSSFAVAEETKKNSIEPSSGTSSLIANQVQGESIAESAPS